jgi:hypothetical protein
MPVRTRLVLAVAAVATLAGVTAGPAQANIPPTGTEFQIKTAFEGSMLCVSSDKKDAATWALVPCDREDIKQHWKRSPSGRNIVSVATKQCIATHSLVSDMCKHGRDPQGEPWQQGRYGRVWRKGDNSITKTFFEPIAHQFHGPVLGFVGTTNGVTPERAGFFAFDTV